MKETMVTSANIATRPKTKATISRSLAAVDGGTASARTTDGKRKMHEGDDDGAVPWVAPPATADDRTLLAMTPEGTGCIGVAALSLPRCKIHRYCPTPPKRAPQMRIPYAIWDVGKERYKAVITVLPQCNKGTQHGANLAKTKVTIT